MRERRASLRLARSPTASPVPCTIRDTAARATPRFPVISRLARFFLLHPRAGRQAGACIRVHQGERAMSLSLLLLIVLIVLLVGAVPAWPYSRGWGYGPSGGLGLVLVIVLVLFLMGRI